MMRKLSLLIKSCTIRDGKFMAFYEDGENKIYYQTWGENNHNGLWVTLINGHMRTVRDFTMFATYLARSGFQVLAFDNRGAGQTQSSDGFSLEDIAKDAHKLWSHLEIRRSHLVGISMGGIIAQIIVRLFPENLHEQKLCLISTCFDQKYLKLESIDWPFGLDDIIAILQNYFSPDFCTKNHLLIKAIAKEFQKEIIERSFNERAKKQKQAIEKFDFDSYKKYSVQNEILIFHGDLDTIIPIQAVFELKKLYPQAAQIVFEDAGHLLIAEKSAQLYQSVISFFVGTSFPTPLT